MIGNKIRQLLTLIKNENQLKEDCDVYEERVMEADEELEQLRKEKEAEIAKRVEFATKYDTLSDYFKEKEDGLHCRLSELQVRARDFLNYSSFHLLHFMFLILRKLSESGQYDLAILQFIETA